MESLTRVLQELLPIIQRIGGRGHDGDDLFGDVALACVEKKDLYDWSHPLIKGRIIRIAKNLRIKSLRRGRLRKHASLPSDDYAALSAAECVGDDEPNILSNAMYAVVVNRLPDSYRHLIQEHFTRGKRLATIAEELNIPSATVRTRFRRALRQIAVDATICELRAD